ncbi:MAG TPA: GatB/YqeY domain-containing protein [Candidatus Angelobacter sp.]|nr:GatB/YqeY domain-containing protein [Candidatus Angelobacter sp.]
MDDLEQRLHDDLTAAIRSRDEVTTATLRMALTAMKNEAVSGSEARVLTDADVVAVLGREAKRRRESAAAYDEANRPELAARERAELSVLEGYLPAQLSDDELAALVEVAVAETGADSPRAMGTVMKVLGPRVAGRADGGRVAAAVRAALGG